MVKNIRPLVDKIDTAAWLNAVRRTQGNEYRERIPEATQANLKETISGLWDWIPGRNQVQDALLNQLGLVVFRNTLWSNPLGIFKMGMLEEGETIEEVFVGLLEAIDYDFDRDELEREIFGDAPIEVQTSFHKRNRKDRYKFTMNLPGLRNALLGNQLGSYASSVMSAPQTSDQWDEYLLMTRLFKEMDDADAFFNVQVDDVSDQGSDSADSRFLLRRMREFSNTLPFISRMYNPAGMPVAANPGELVLVTTAAAEAAMDVEALAGAFNISKAEMTARRIVLPTEHIGIEGFQAAITTDKFFVVADNLITTTSQFNPAKLTTNYWLHHWQTISASRFAPLIMFNSVRPSTVISPIVHTVTDIGAFTFKDKLGNTAATNLTRGVLYDVLVEAVTTPVGGVAALDLSIEGKTSVFTYITNNGDLFVGPDEEANTLTIRATSVDNNYNETVTRGVTGNLIKPWPNGSVLTDVDSDTIEEAILNADTLKMVNLKVKIPTNTRGYNLTRTIKEAVAFTDVGDVVTVPKHGAVAGDTVTFGAITGTTGITASTVYYVKDVLSENTFTIAASAGGAILPLTTNGTAVSAQFTAKDGKTYTIAGLTEFIATAEAGYEIAAGSVTSWSFDTP